MPESLRFLIVDEDPDSRVDARKAVQRAQLVVADEVGYGTPAVSAALEVHPDIVLVAVEQPAARALETIVSVSNALPETPFVVYSSARDHESVRRSMVVGARDYILKPVQTARLLEAVETVLDQEERHRLRQSGEMLDSAGRGSVITITGAKGGIGKSVIAVNLALGLHRETGRSVAIVDADTHFGDVATMLDLGPGETLADLLVLLDKLDREKVRECLTAHSSGISVLAGPEYEALSDRDPERIVQAIDLLAKAYDYVVIDTGELSAGVVRACLESSTLVLLVTSGEVSSIRDTASALRRITEWNVDDDRVRVLFNRSSRVDGFRIEDLQEAIKHDVFWQVPFDRRMPMSVQLGQPVMLEGKSDAARNLAVLARRIAGTRTSDAEPHHARSFWKRLSLARRA